MTADLLGGLERMGEQDETHAACWRPLPLRAELVRTGDLVVGKDGRPLYVDGAAPAGEGKVLITVRTPTPKAWTMPADRPVKILVPETERTALHELRRQLGAGITDRSPGSN